MVEQHPLAAAVQNYRPLAELVPAHWQTGAVEAADGTPIHYTRTGGEKPAVVLLHGFQAAGLMWLRTARALEATCDVIMPDFRGHGQSGGVEHGFSMGLLVGDVAALIGALELDRPFVIGHSMGAEVAGRLAAGQPLRAVALVDPALQRFPTFMEGDTPPAWMQAIFDAMRALRAQSHEQRLITALKLLPPGAPLWDEADYVSFVEGMAQFDLETYPYALNMSYLFEAADVIRRIDCPILLLTARAMMPSMDKAPGVAAFVRNWRVGRHVHFEDSGHFIPFDLFDRFIETLTGFLNET